MEELTRRTANRNRRRRNKSTNPFKAYFSNFGLRQTAGLLMIAAAIVLIVGLAIKSELTIIIGISVYLAAAVISLVITIISLARTHKKSPAHKRSAVNLVVMSVIVLIAVAMLLYTLFNGIYR